MKTNPENNLEKKQLTYETCRKMLKKHATKNHN